jgi:hypothetical protein
MKLTVVPVTIKQAKAYVALHHRHLPVVGWGRFAVGVAVDEQLVGVGIVGNGPAAWEGSRRALITRVATDGTRNACSAIYGALCRAARALGYLEAWTYTLPSEPGTSLRAAGFEPAGMTRGGEHDRVGRPRAPARHPEPKRRWVRQLVGSGRLTQDLAVPALEEP